MGGGERGDEGREDGERREEGEEEVKGKDLVSIISFTPSSLLHLPLLSLDHMYSFTYFFVCILHVYRYVYKWSCIFHFIIYLFIILLLFFFCLSLCSTCVHVCVNGHGRAAFWLNGHDLTLNIEH